MPSRKPALGDKLLCRCLPKHSWAWNPDDMLSDFWQQLSEEEQNQIVDTDESTAELSDRLKRATCFLKEHQRCIAMDSLAATMVQGMWMSAVVSNVPIVLDSVTTPVVIEDILSDARQECGTEAKTSFKARGRNFVEFHAQQLILTEMYKMFDERLMRLYEERHQGAAEMAIINARQATLGAREAAKIAKEEAEQAADFAMAELLSMEGQDHVAKSGRKKGKKSKGKQSAEAEHSQAPVRNADEEPRTCSQPAAVSAPSNHVPSQKSGDAVTRWIDERGGSQDRTHMQASVNQSNQRLKLLCQALKEKLKTPTPVQGDDPLAREVDALHSESESESESE